MSAPAQCVLHATSGCRAPRPCSRSSWTTPPARSRRRGSPAASACSSTGSNGSSCPIPRRPRRRCRTARSTGGRTPSLISCRMNHLHPPFNDLKVRRAVLTALNQEDYMRALVGDEDKLWKALPGFFTPDTPLYTEEGGEVLKMRNLEAAKKLLAESSYAGQPVVCVVAQDQPITKAFGDVTADLLKQLGMKVDFVATDWGTVGARRAQKTPPGQGGWNMFHTWHAGSDCINPAPYNAVRGTGDKAWFGWPTSANVEKEVTAWFDAKNLDEEKSAVKRLNKVALEDVVYAPTGFFLSYTAWRKNVSGITKGPLPFFWGVSKSA